MRSQLRYFPILLLFLCFFLTFHTLKGQCGSFYDGFESGVIGPQWTIGTGTYTRSVPNTNSPVGTYHVEQTCTTSNNFYQGMYAVFTPAQPTYFSFWMRTNTTSAANGYVVIGNSNIGSDNGILFCYFNTTSSLRFFNTTGYNHPITANTWYHVECRNVSWTNRTMDIWINNALILTAWAFRSTTANDVDRIHLHSLSASTVEYDDIQIGAGGPQITNVATVSPGCFGDTTGSIDLTTTSTNGSLTYAWSNGAGTQDVMNIGAGTYAVSITDSLGCSLSDSFTITGPTQVAPTGTTIDVTCPGDASGAIDVTTSGGSPGYSYLWTNNATTEDLSNLAGGTYTVTVTDLNGCTGTNNFVVTEPAPFLANPVIDAPTCIQTQDGSIDYFLSGGTGSYTYLWSTGDTTFNISGLGVGTYSVHIIDSLGCSYLDTLQLASGPGVLANATFTEPACHGFGNGSVTLNPTGGTPIYTYIWSTGASSQNLPAATAGDYFVTITDANGCITIDTITVTEPAAIATSGTTTAATGGGNNGAIDLTVSGGTPPFSYLWSNNATTQDLSGIVGNATYSVIITDANGCQALDTFFVDDVIAVTNGLGTSITAWPNPFDQTFSVEVVAASLEPISLTVTDLAGKSVWSAANMGTGKIQVTTPLSSGVYLLKMKQGEHMTTLRMMKR